MSEPLFEQQKSLEAIAEKLTLSPALLAKKAEIFDQLRSEPAYSSAAGKSTLQRAVDEMANAAALYAANSDPARPRLAWTFSGPVTLGGNSIAGRRWGGDNPDNLYRFFPIDGDSSYEITVRPGGLLPAQFSFVIWDTFMGESTKQATKGQDKLLDIVIAALLDRDVTAESDGSFKITIDSRAADGRPNHLRSNADARVVLVRDTFSDWGTQAPLQIDIVRLSGPEVVSAPDPDVLALRAAHILGGVTSVLHWWLNNTEGFATAEPNTMGTPYLRGGGWGLSSSGQYKLGSDEALVVTADPLGAKYLSAVVWDPWTVSREHVRRTASLNNTQASANQDGTYSYVVSAADPGVRNWIDIEGLEAGFFFLRWQSLPKSLTSADGAVRSIQLVKFKDLTNYLPKDTAYFTPQMREEQCAERARTLPLRYGFPGR